MKQSVSLSTGVRIEYVEHGKADGMPVIFLHGVTDSWRSFERVLPLLPPGIHAFALSQRFVIDHPDRVERLVLMGAFSTFDDPGLAAFVASSIAPLADPIAAPLAREWQLSTLARAMPADHLDAVVSETLKVPARVWREAFEGFVKTPDFTGELTKVSVPVLLMWGDRDSYALRAAQDRLLAVMPTAQFVVYQGFGHAFHWEDPEQFTRDLVPFLRSRTGSDSPVRQTTQHESSAW